MKFDSKKMHGQLTELHSISKELNSLLMNGEAEVIIEKLKQRAVLLTEVQENSTSVDNKSKQSKELKTIVNLIMNLDKKNMEVMQQKLTTVSDSITDLGKEHKAIRNLRSVTKKDHKQLIDFLY